MNGLQSRNKTKIYKLLLALLALLACFMEKCAMLQPLHTPDTSLLARPLKRIASSEANSRSSMILELESSGKHSDINGLLADMKFVSFSLLANQQPICFWIQSVACIQAVEVTRVPTGLMMPPMAEEIVRGCVSGCGRCLPESCSLESGLRGFCVWKADKMGKGKPEFKPNP